MKRKSLNFKLMITFISVLIFFAIITYTLLVESFQNYYHEDIYRVLEDNNDTSKVVVDIDEFINNSNQDDRSIERLFWTMINGELTIRNNRKTSDLTEDIIQQIEDNIHNQEEKSKRYSTTVNGRKLFYVILEYKMSSRHKLINPIIPKPIERQKVIDQLNLNDQQKVADQQSLIDQQRMIERQKAVMQSTVYQVTLRWEPLDDTLRRQLFRQMGIGLLLTMLAMLVVFFFFSRHLTKPLIQLSRSVKQISKRKFDVPITINQNDEIGFLASTVEEMRKELLSYDEEQKLKLHSISHELKTPIMIIQSYIDALRKGLYPKGTQESSLEVIDEECSRLQKLVFNLLYIQRLEYFDSEIKNKEQVNLKDVIEEVLDSMTLKSDHLRIELQMDDVQILADYNQMKIAIENVLSNQLRYAHSLIRIMLKKDINGISLEFYNDGEHLENEKEIFKMFKKGKKGQSGLGLYIVKRLIEINDGRIIAYNEAVGVTFKMEWN